MNENGQNSDMETEVEVSEKQLDQDLEDYANDQNLLHGERIKEKDPNHGLHGSSKSLKKPIKSKLVKKKIQRKQAQQSKKHPKPCFFFRRGNCNRGAQCRFSHQRTNFQPQRSNFQRRNQRAHNQIYKPARKYQEGRNKEEKREWFARLATGASGAIVAEGTKACLAAIAKAVLEHD